MRCLICWRFSWSLVCSRCQEEMLRPKIERRKVCEGFEVVSFYGYEEIAPLLHTKHIYIGSAIYKILAKRALRPFAKLLEFDASLVPIDDRVRPYYAHTAILVRAMETKRLRPRYRTLRASNPVSYAGRSLAFRRANPRNFRYEGMQGDIVLVDDIVTTGLTMSEAYEACRAAGANPLFGVVLADARR